MASADFCILTVPITQNSAVYPHFLSAFFISYLTIKAGHSLFVPGYLCTGTPPPVISLETNFILHGIQISPDNDVNFRYANVSFTVSPALWA
jgi:hypothetical protein